MGSGRSANLWAEVQLPGWVGGFNPKGFLKTAGFQVKPSQAGWSICTNESYFERAPRFVSVVSVVAAGQIPSASSAIARGSTGIVHDLGGVKALLPPPPQNMQLLDLLNYGRLAVTLGDETTASEAAFDLLAKVRTVRTKEDERLIFPNSELFSLVPNHVLYTRAKLPQMLARLSIDPEFDANRAFADLDEGSTVFRSAEGLSSGIYMMDAYTGPLMAALSPGVWAIEAPRDAPLFLSLGAQVAGTTPLASDLLSTISRPGADRTVEFGALRASSGLIATEWWIDRLNALFGVISDPAVFVDRDGVYQPIRHLESLLTIEQLFRRTTSIRLNHQDAHAARTLMFSVLDTLEALSGWQIGLLFRSAFAAKTLDRIRGCMPTAAQDILLPACTRALDSLREVGEGFFLRDTGGRIPCSRAGRSLDPETATSEFLRLLRNATHGFGPRKGSQAQLDLATELIARHDGRLPSDLALLSHLYLLGLLVDPSPLRNTLSAARGR